MKSRIKKLSYKEYLKYIEVLTKDLNSFLTQNKLKVDYLVPILRSGAVPAVYIANALNIVKFAPFQVKHIKYKNNTETIEILFNSLNSINVKKQRPVFLVVEATHSTGKSAQLCIDEILKKFPTAQILYICIAKAYGSLSFKNKTIYEACAFCMSKNLPMEDCKKLNILPYSPIYPWENIKDQIEHPDDLEENIFF